MDKIILKGMQFFGFHGVLAAEKELGQKFIVDIEMFLDLSLAGKSDDLEQTINYADIYALTKDIMEKASFNLIEGVVEKIAEGVLKKELVKKVRVKIEKPNAPVRGVFEHMAVEIERESLNKE